MIQNFNEKNEFKYGKFNYEKSSSNSPELR